MGSSEELTSINSYGRKAWNKEAYAKLALEKRLGKPKVDEKEKIDITKRKVSVDFEANLNKVELVNQASSVSVHKGKSSGFYCDVCNLTFKDNLSFLNHINSTKHLENSEYKTSHLNYNITVEDIRSKLESVYNQQMRQQEKENDLQVFNLKRRIEQRKVFEQKKAARKRQKKLEKRQQKQRETVEDNRSNNDEIFQQMGFDSFASTGK